MIAAMDIGAVWQRIENAFTRLTLPARLRVVIYIVFALQVAKVAWLIPVEEIFDGSPLTPYHFSQLYSDVSNDRQLMKISNRSWGYDPFIGAGQPVGSGLVAESHGPILFDRLLRRWVSPAATIKLFFWLAFLAGPLLVVGAARFFLFDEASAAIAFVLVAGGALGHEYLSRTLLYRGNITLWLAAHLALFNAGAFYAGLTRNSRLAALAYAVTLPCLVLFDPAVAVMQLVPVIVLMADASARQRRLALAWTAAGLALTIPLNAFWLRPFFIFHRFSTGDVGWGVPGMRGFLASVLPPRNYSLGTVWAGLRAYILIFGISELVFIFKEKRELSRAMLAWAGALFLIGFFGGHFAWIRNLEPTRLGLEFFLVITIPASALMASTCLKPGSRRIILLVWGLWFLVSWQAVNRWDFLPLRASFTPIEKQLLVDIRTLPRDRRILVQYSPAINDMLRMSAVRSDRSFVGFAPSWSKTDFGRSACFDSWNGHSTLFGKPLESYDASMLQAALERYNVGTLIVMSKDARKIMDGFPDIVTPFRTPEPHDAYSIYEARSKRNSYFITGSGWLWFEHNLIHVRPKEPGPLLLSLHWVQGLTAKPPVTVRSRYLEDDPVPFIFVDNTAGVKDFEIRFEPR